MNYNPSAEPICSGRRTTKSIYLLIAVAFVAVMLFTPFYNSIQSVFLASATSTKTYLMGDVDGNGKVEPSDARTVLRVSVQLDTLEGVGTDGTVSRNDADPTKGQLADIDGDGKITPADARAILRMAVQLDAQKTIEVEESTKNDTAPSRQYNQAEKEEILKNIDEFIQRQRGGTDPARTFTEEQISTIENEMKAMVERGASWREIEKYGSDSFKAIIAAYYEEQRIKELQETTAIVDPSTVIEVPTTIPYKPEETTARKVPSELPTDHSKTEEPTTYWTGEKGEFCRWCGKPHGINPETGEPYCYHSTFAIDLNCPGCGQFVKAYTCHDCKAYYILANGDDFSSFSGDEKSENSEIKSYPISTPGMYKQD